MVIDTKANRNTIDKESIRYMIYSHIFTIVLVLLFVTFLPYLVDFYVLQPDMTFWDYYMQHIIDRYYTFETFSVTLFVTAVWISSGKSGVAMLGAAVPLLILAHATGIKYAARGELFRLDDLKLTEAAGMAVHYLDLDFSNIQLKVIGVVLMICISGFVADKFCRKYSLTMITDKKLQKMIHVCRVSSVWICFIAMLCYGGYFMTAANSRESVDVADTVGTGNDRYILYNFLKNDSLANITMENVQESYEFFRNHSLNEINAETTKRKQLPSIIVIMNESWWHTDNIMSGNIKFSSDPMEPYRRLAGECSSGQLSANIFGGGTISSEAEFLTGLNTKYFLSDIGIYSELQERKLPSIVDYFHDMDYDTVAIHPYYGEFYDRDIIYPQLGFDQIIFEEDMQYTDVYSQYISDESLARQIIKEYEEGQDAQQFIFAVSIANHIRVLDYKKDFVDDYPYPIIIIEGGESLSGKDRSDLVNYMNGIYLANEAFEQLMSYFSQIKEPVVVVMYGDHAPGFSKDILTLLGLDGTDWETQKRLYSVPVLMWSNFDGERIHFSGENINYLPQIVLDYAGLPESDMTQILCYEKRILKSNTRRVVEDANGQPVQTYNEEQTEAVRHFKVVDYDILFGSSTERDKVWQPHGAVE